MESDNTELVQMLKDRCAKAYRLKTEAWDAWESNKSDLRALDRLNKRRIEWEAITDLAISVCGVIGEGWAEVASTWNCPEVE